LTPAFQPPSRLNAILDYDVAARFGWSLPALADAYLDGGARFLQVRAKTATGADLLRLCEEIVERAQRFGACVMVNDRADIARLARASGVHVGQEDLRPSAVRAIVGADGIVGLSTHNDEQVRSAATEPIDYLAVGPIFETASKETPHRPVGLELVRAARAAGLPVVAIGGISLDRAVSVINAGASAVAVISDLLATGTPAARVREYLQALE
jgi:thiamine-phosphate pyrophosphorylase